MQTARQSGDFDNLVNAYQIMASYYRNIYQQRKDKPLLDSALFYNKTGLKLFSEHGDHIILQSTLGVIALNTADLYERFFPASYKDSVIYYLNIALKAGVGTRQFNIVSLCYGMMSDYEIVKGNYKKAEELLLTRVSKLRSYNLNNPRTMAQFMEALSALYERMGNHVAALKYYKEFYNLHRQLYNAEKLATANRLEAQYQLEKKDAALKALSHTAALNKKLNYLYISLAIAAIIAFKIVVNMVVKAFLPDPAFLSQTDILDYNNLILSFLRFSPSQLYTDATTVMLMPAVRSLGPLTMEQMAGAMPSPLSFRESVLIVWPQVTGLIAATVMCFAISYYWFMRREIRS